MRRQLCLTEYFLLTVVDPPLTPPPLSTPAGAERGANSRIWACFLIEDVQHRGQWPYSDRRVWRLCRDDFSRPGGLKSALQIPQQELGAKQNHPAHKPSQLVRRPSTHKATYGCWPLFPPRRGWKEAGEIGGEKTNKNTFPYPTKALSSKPSPTAGAKKCP
jgi:hypothetical protein